MNLLYIILPTAILLIALGLTLRKFGKSKIPSATNNNEDTEILEIQMPKNDDDAGRDVQSLALAAENMYASLHGLLREDPQLQEHLSFELVSSIEGIKFFVVVPKAVIKFVESQIYAQHPTAHIRIVQDYTASGSASDSALDARGSEYEIINLALQKDEFFPIKTFRDFEVDPLSAVTSTLSEVIGDEQVWFQVTLKPIPDVWQKEGYEYVNALRTGSAKRSGGIKAIVFGLFAAVVNELVMIVYTMATQLFKGPSSSTEKGAKVSSSPLQPKLSPVQELELKGIENKLSRMGYLVQVRIVCFAKNVERVQTNIRSVTASMKQFSTATSNSLVPVVEHNKEEALENYKHRNLEESKAFVLSLEELATIYHFPSTNVETPHISWLYSKKSEPPAGLPTQDCNYIGETIYRSNKVRFGIKNGDDRLRHMYLIGKTGTGKSTLFENMVSQDIAKGFGVGVLDPHGELIEKVLDYIPDNRIQDVILFDPSDSERPVGLNLLEMDDPSQKNLMASALVSAIKQHFDYSWGPRLEYLLNYCILTLLDVEGTSMLGITRLMEDDNYRKYILHFVKDPMTIKFWDREFKDMKGNQKLVTEAIAPIQNKVNRFLASTTIRNILGQKKSTINIWDAMNSGKILLMNLSKGKIGADNANLLGALLVSRIQFMALQRAKIPYAQRKPFYLYVDEFQNFATGSFEEILSESRKYKLGLHLTHQFTAQLPETLLKAVYGNVGTIATFSLGAPDARALASEFSPFFSEEDIISLERFHMYIKLMIDGMTSLPFSTKLLLPWDSEESIVPKYPQNHQKVIDYSRQTFGVEREFIEAKINRWVEAPFDKGMAIAQEMKDKKTMETGSSGGAPTGGEAL